MVMLSMLLLDGRFEENPASPDISKSEKLKTVFL